MRRDFYANPLQDLPEPIAREAEARLRAGQSVARVTRFVMGSPRGQLCHEPFYFLRGRVVAARQWLQLHPGEQLVSDPIPGAPDIDILRAKCLDAAKRLAARLKDREPLLALCLVLTLQEVDGALQQGVQGRAIKVGALVTDLLRLDQALRDMTEGAAVDELDPALHDPAKREHALPELIKALPRLEDAQRTELRRALESLLQGVQLHCGVDALHSQAQRTQPAAPTGNGGDPR